ncbi:MAG: glycerol-3-phosphate 1-O-acyltransferase PlsY [Burkholderiales bacterium]
MIEAVFVVCAYLIGSLSFAVIVSRLFGLPDPRKHGSGNPGATNVLRTGKYLAAALTLLGDAGKGWLAVVVARMFEQQFSAHPDALAGVVLAVFLGHLWPLFFGFQGGKGVATAGGILLAIHPWLGLGTISTWIVIFAFFRISSLAALIAAAFAPFAYLLLFEMDWMAVAVSAVSILLIWRHRANIGRLLAGTEGGFSTVSKKAGRT